MTIEQIRNKTKTVTRRLAWWDLNPGEIIKAVERTRGLKKGEKINQLALIRIISIREEPLNIVNEDELIKEGFPEMTTTEFITMLSEYYKVPPSTSFNRIEFEYV